MLSQIDVLLLIANIVVIRNCLAAKCIEKCKIKEMTSLDSKHLTGFIPIGSLDTKGSD
jgi:hypothetical protein